MFLPCFLSCPICLCHLWKLPLDFCNSLILTNLFDRSNINSILVKISYKQDNYNISLQTYIIVHITLQIVYKVQTQVQNIKRMHYSFLPDLYTTQNWITKTLYPSSREIPKRMCALLFIATYSLSKLKC